MIMAYRVYDVEPTDPEGNYDEEDFVGEAGSLAEARGLAIQRRGAVIVDADGINVELHLAND